MLCKSDCFSLAKCTRTWAEQKQREKWVQKKNWALITKRSVIVPYLKYPPGIITTSRGAKDRADTTLIQHSPNEASKRGE